jgi:hypothetical protein
MIVHLPQAVYGVNTPLHPSPLFDRDMRGHKILTVGKYLIPNFYNLSKMSG